MASSHVPGVTQPLFSLTPNIISNAYSAPISMGSGMENLSFSPGNIQLSRVDNSTSGAFDTFVDSSALYADHFSGVMC